MEYKCALLCDSFNKNINRNLELKNKLTGTRGEGGEREWGKTGEGPSRDVYKGHVDKAKAGRFKGGRQGWVGWRAEVG